MVPKENLVSSQAKQSANGITEDKSQNHVENVPLGLSAKAIFIQV